MVDEWGAAVVGGAPVRATGEAGGTPEAPEAETEARGGAGEFFRVAPPSQTSMGPLAHRSQAPLRRPLRPALARGARLTASDSAA